MSLNDDTMIARVALRHNASPDAVRAAFAALRASGGSMAQFSHPDFGGMAQWSRGMTMVGDMFNTEMKTKLDAICNDLAAHLANEPRSQASSPDRQDNERQDNGRQDNVSYRSTSSSHGSWWPNDLGEPGSVGAQNDMRYAVFPSSRRLAISDGGTVTVYDTGDHRISGVSQAQSTGQTLTFTSQDGLVRVSDLAKLSG